VPTYVYKFVDTGETIEVQQSFNDPTLTETTHPVTGASMPVKKVFQPVGVTFKGTGFYKTDSRGSSGSPGKQASTASTDTPSSTSSSSTSSSSDGVKSESKTSTAAPSSTSSSE
jgi:predicted nucleic acid-binding Zn ribbon protein